MSTRPDPQHGSARGERRSRPVHLGRSVVVAALAVALGSLALAFEPVEGMELLVTDARGGMLLGYGRIEAEGLVLELASLERDLRVILVQPDGVMVTYRAEFASGRVVVIRSEDDRVDLAERLADIGMTLTLDLPEGRTVVAVDRDPDLVAAPEPPDGDPLVDPVVTGPGPGSPPGPPGGEPPRGRPDFVDDLVGPPDAEPDGNDVDVDTAPTEGDDEASGVAEDGLLDQVTEGEAAPEDEAGDGD
jgi:hypothetical protein